MDKSTQAFRASSRLFLPLGIWAASVAMAVGVLRNVDEFDAVGPRASPGLVGGDAHAALVGAPVEADRQPLLACRWRLIRDVKTPEEVRAMVTFCRQAGRSDVPALKEMALMARGPLAAGNAIRALGRLGVLANDTQLVALLSDKRSRVRQEAVRALGDSGRPASLPLLEPLVEDEDSAIRLLAIQAIGEIGGQRATVVLRGVLSREDSTRAERAFARAALP